MIHPDLSSSIGRFSRRDFIRRSALATGSVALGGGFGVRADDASAPLNVAVIGLGGQGTVRLKEALAGGANVVALCDVDEALLAAATREANAKTYTDFRELLKTETKLAAVIVATPDHWHAPIARAAMLAGKHVFCEKPLTRTIGEARALRELARQSKVVTQMGNQGSASPNMRRAIELIQGGAIGRVREVYLWTAPSHSFKPAQPMPTGEDPVPAGLHWDAWLGPAPARPYKQHLYHPKNWRAWYDFGGGSIADWGCHNFNLPFRALKLDYPTRIAADAQIAGGECYSKGVRIRFEFAARAELPPVTLWWFDGGRLPPEKMLPPEILAHLGKMPEDGVLLLGDEGFTYGSPHPGANYIMLKGEKKLSDILNHAATKDIARSLPRVKGHMEEWLTACRGGPAPFSDFETGGKLTEIVLAGVVALRAGKKLHWDGIKMRATNTAAADPFIRANYRAGWI